jgi:hypothetical protein
MRRAVLCLAKSRRDAVVKVSEAAGHLEMMEKSLTNRLVHWERSPEHLHRFTFQFLENLF